ncbi:unnamed protein product, partial [Staurois parvus]
MQTASTNICERIGCSQELSEFKRGTMIGCHLCNTSIHYIFLLLNIPKSTVSGIITILMQLGTTATQPQSGRPHKMAQQSLPNVQKSPTVYRYLFFRGWAWPFSSSEAYQDILDNW